MTNRLRHILSALPHCNTLCDVGCDHGYVGIAALQNDVARRVIFVDISADCLNKARNNCPQGLQTRASFVVRDGIGDIEADAAVIAGMGGLEIISILQGAKTLPNYLVLQPMRNQYDARKFLLQKYEIVRDYKFFDGKYYDLITAKLSKTQSLDELELTFGKDNLRSPTADFIGYLNNEKNKLTTILQGCGDVSVQKRLEKVDAAFAQIKEKTL